MWRSILLLLAAGLIASCGRAPEFTHHRLAAFGTEVTISVPADEGAAEVVAEIDREFQKMHRRWHAWEPGTLEEINRAIAAGRKITLEPETIAIIRRARSLEIASDGLFNPAIGQLLSRWGFHASTLPQGPPPTDATISELVEKAPSTTDLELGPKTLSSRNAAVQLDFGAYIKGVAVERALDIASAAGIEHILVNAGGDLGVLGQRGNRPWRVAVQHPDGQGGHYLAGIEAHSGEFVFTSGNYRRYRHDEGIRRGHIIDPRDGYPAEQVSSVTIIAREGGLADAAATALAVARSSEWQRVAEALGIEHIIRVSGDGTVRLTPAMADRVRWREEPEIFKVVSPPDAD